MPSTKLTRAYGSGVTGNRTKWTISGWYKLDKGAVASGERTMLGVHSNGSYFTSLAFLDDGRINFMDYYNNSINGRVRTNALHRDVNGWYHVVGVFDKDNSTSGDRIRLWVNGVRITGSLAQYENMPSQASTINSDSQTLEVGTLNNTSHFGGIMSHLHFCDGYAYDASYFGSTDSTTGEWKINTSPSVSYGTQGWFWLKDNNATTDNSPNSNTFTVSSGTLTKTENNPSNVFATLNPLTNQGSYTFEHGNNSLEGNNTNAWTKAIGSTLGASSGKYYWEVRQVSGSHTDYNIFGFVKADKAMDTSANVYSSGNFNGVQSHSSTPSVYAQTGAYSGYLKIAGSHTAISNNDVVSFALDLDNRKCWLAVNGVWVDDKNGNANGSSINTSYPLWGTGEITADTVYMPCSIQYYDPKCQYNFGNGYFGTTVVSSEGTNASNNGIFEYNVPTGYTALSTKGLNL